MRTFNDTTYSITLNRILASKQMRRLKGKKQVFSLLVAQTDSKADYIHERLLHTLEVCSAAKEIMKKICKEEYIFTMKGWADVTENIKYSEDLLDAIAFAHDFGHTPFGHIGEQALTHYMNGKNKAFRTFFPDGDKHGELVFKHNFYSAALLKRNFSICSPDIIDGVLKHTKINKFDGVEYNGEKKRVFGAHSFLPETLRKTKGYLDNTACYTLEGQVVAMADEVAQMLSDLEDSNLVMEHLFTDNELKVLFKNEKQTLKEFLLEIRDKMVKSLILQTRQNIQKYLTKKELDSKVVYFDEKVVDFDDEMKEVFEYLETLRKKRLHGNEIVEKQNSLSYLIIFKIFDYYLGDPDALFGNDHKSFEYIINNFIQIRDDSKYKKGDNNATKYFDYVCNIKKYNETLYTLIENLKTCKYNEDKEDYRKRNLTDLEQICKELGKYYFTKFGYDTVMDSMAMSLMREISFSIGKMTDNFAVSTFFKSFDRDHRDLEINNHVDKCCSAHITLGKYTIDEKLSDFFKNRLFVLKTCLTTMKDYNKV